MGMFDCCEEIFKAKKKSLLYTDWNEQRAATSGQEIMGKFDCCEKIINAKKRSLLDTDWTSRKQQQVDWELWKCLILVRKLFVCCEEIMKAKKRSLLGSFSDSISTL
jgi:hypothetical protein